MTPLAVTINDLERKRLQLDAALAALHALQTGELVKRKRGRPRKVQQIDQPEQAMRATA